jgi:hypothetical protein
LNFLQTIKEWRSTQSWSHNRPDIRSSHSGISKLAWSSSSFEIEPTPRWEKAPCITKWATTRRVRKLDVRLPHADNAVQLISRHRCELYNRNICRNHTAEEKNFTQRSLNTRSACSGAFWRVYGFNDVLTVNLRGPIELDNTYLNSSQLHNPILPPRRNKHRVRPVHCISMN